MSGADQSKKNNLTSVNFEQILSCAPGLIWSANEIGHGVWFGSDWQHFRGIKVSDDCIEGWHLALHEDDLNKFLYVFRGAYATRNNFETLCRLRRSDGVFRWMKISGRPLLENENFAGFVMTCFDISDSKEIHDKIQQNEMRLRKLLDEALVGFAETDAHEIIRYANPSFCQMMGYNRMEILGKGLEKLILPEDLEGLNAQIKRMLDSKAKAVEHHVRFFHKEGEIIHGLLKISPIRSGSGIISGFNTQTIDISEMTNLEQNLQRSNDRFQLALRTGQIGVWDWDLQRNLLHWDESHYRLYEIDPQIKSINDLKEWSEVMHERDGAQLERQIENLLAGEDSKVYKYRILCSDKSIRYICISAILEKDEHGNPLRITGLSWNVTDLHNKERDLNLRTAQSSIASRMEAFSELAKVISHELENPIHQLAELTELARQAVTSIYSEGAENFVAKTLDLLQSLEQETHNVLKIVKDSEKLSEIPAGNSIISYPLDRILEDSILYVEPRIRRNQIQMITTQWQSTQGVQVQCVPRQLTHILLSVLGESVSQVKDLDDRWILVEKRVAGNFVQVKIVNSGIILPSKNEGVGLQVINTLLNHSGGSISFDPIAVNTTYIIEVPILNKTKLSSAA